MRVLIVEDDIALQRFLTRGFARHGHTAACAEDGVSALQQPAGAHDLVLLDLGLPQQDGTDVLQALRQREPLLPVLVLTGRDSLEDRLTCFSLGADDFVRKPFSFQELLARCVALHRRAESAAGGLLTAGELRLNRMDRRVTVCGTPADLTGKEFALLEYLMLHRGRAVSRRELLDEVWRSSPDAGANVVDVYVNYVRRKLAATGAASANLLETVRGEGYRVPLSLESSVRAEAA